MKFYCAECLEQDGNHLNDCSRAPCAICRQRQRQPGCDVCEVCDDSEPACTCDGSGTILVDGVPQSCPCEALDDQKKATGKR